jgi:hypothetical protein
MNRAYLLSRHEPFTDQVQDVCFWQASTSSRNQRRCPQGFRKLAVAGQGADPICYDFLDLERLAMYRGRVHHFFVLAYNRDFESFYHSAEAFSRMACCNVVVCNTGYYGGSLAVSPYKEPFRRTIYRSQGAQLFSSQIIELPVDSLDKHQRTWTPKKDAEFKGLPPGYIDYQPLVEEQAPPII